MNITYWGTGGYEAIPAPFCVCPVCENAREKKGKEIRTRHSATIDDVILLDLSPDIFMQTLSGLDLRNVRYLLVTHGHYDHFDALRLDIRRHPFALTHLPELTVVGNAHVIDQITHMGAFSQLAINTIQTEYFKPIAIDASTVVTPLPGNHAKEIGGCNLYHISRNGKQLLYAHDSGPFEEEVFRYLSGKQMDAVSLDCADALASASPTHMNISSCDETVRRLLDDGSLKSDGISIYSHFSHGGGATHARLETESKPRGWIPAFDGMNLTL